MRGDKPLGGGCLVGRRTGEKLVQDAAQSIDVAPPVEVGSPSACSGLM